MIERLYSAPEWVEGYGALWRHWYVVGEWDEPDVHTNGQSDEPEPPAEVPC